MFACLVLTSAVLNWEGTDGVVTDSTLHSDNGRMGTETQTLLNDEESAVNELPLRDALESERSNVGWPVVFGQQTTALKDDPAPKLVSGFRTSPATLAWMGTGCCKPLLCRCRPKYL